LTNPPGMPWALSMRRRGYKTSMAVGPIIGVGGLAMLITPSSLAVVLASIGHMSVGKILIGGFITPPFGMLLFVMKGVAPEDVNIEESPSSCAK